MRVVYKITLCFALTFSIHVYSFAMQIIFESRYISIDSLSMNDISRHVNLDLKTKSINVRIDNTLTTFFQTYDIDTSSFKTQYLSSEFDGGKILLQTTELLSVENDSIYVFAIYQRFNEKHNISKPCKIKLAISKSELLGVVVSPTIKEMKKKRRGFFLFLGTLTIIVTALSIIGGG